MTSAADTAEASDDVIQETMRDSDLVALHESLQAVARQTDPRASLTVIAQKAQTLTRAVSAAVMLLDKTRTLLDFAAVAGADAGEIAGQTVRVEDALAGQTALTGEIYVAYNPVGSPPFLAASDSVISLEQGVRSAAVVPIYVAGRTAGALAAINQTDDAAFGSGDLLRLQVLANAAALALSLGETKREASQKQRERDILFQAARSASSSLNVQEVLRSVLDTVSDSLEMSSGAVFLLNDERTRLYIGADVGLEGDDRERQMAADMGLALQILTSGQPLRVDDATQSEFREDLPLPEIGSLLIAPMVARSTAEGLIVVGARRAGAYSQEDALLLSAVASQTAIALENAWLYEDATRRAEEATALYELSQAVGATLQLDRVLQFVADSVLTLLHVDKFALFLYNPRAGQLEIKIARNIRREAALAMKPKLGEGIAGWVLEFETPTAVQDVAADHRNRSCPIDTEGVTSLVSVPLQSGDEVIGVLHAMSSRRRLFTVREMELLYTLANQVGAAIAKAQMYEEARLKSDEIRKYVRRVARALGSSVDAQATAQTIVDLAVEMTDADRGALLVSDAPGRFTLRATSGFKTSVTDAAGGETPCAWIMRRGRSLSLENVAQESRFALPAYLARERVAGYLGVPLKLGKDVLGVLEVFTREPRRFQSDHIRLLITFASQASVGMQNALLVEHANRRLRDLEAFGVLSSLLREPCSFNTLVQTALPLICEATQASTAMILRVGDAAPMIHHQYSPAVNDSGLLADDILQLLSQLELAASPWEPFQIGALPVVAVPLTASRPDAPLNLCVLCRAADQPMFDSHNQQFAATAANLLSLRLE